MLVRQVSSLDGLRSYQARWDELADGCVFRSWDWISTWWQHYGGTHRLAVFLLFSEKPESMQSHASETEPTLPDDSKRLMAILPCYIESSFSRGQVLRLIGDGEVCSDHLDLLAATDDADQAAFAMAGYLHDEDSEWDAIEFTAVGSDCTGLVCLRDQLESLDCQVTLTPNVSRWSIPLPDDWESFLQLQSKSHRKQLRRLEKNALSTNQAVWHLATNTSDFDIAWPILTDLHQRRWTSLGEPGCFASTQWAGFHRDIARRLLDSGRLRLSWLEVCGQPVAAEYHFAGRNTTWAYQGGVDPDRLDEQPGKVSMISCIQHAISEGHDKFDLLRGDEPYKSHWRAVPTETFDMRIVPARSSALLRHQALGCLQSAVRFTRQFTNMLS